jgi:hypothetical protein
MNHQFELGVATALLAICLVGCQSPGVPCVTLRPADAIALPGVPRPGETVGHYDCNNPVHWDGEMMYVFSSTGQPYRASGPDLYHLRRPSQRTTYDNEKGYKGHRWIESTWKDTNGTLYGWYHCEPSGTCPGKHLTAPKIGAVVSDDNGMNWRDLGIVLEAPADSLDCETANQYFAGGNGDFSVIPDRGKGYVYFFISTYHRDPAEQGVSVARMRYADRNDPVGKVRKWHAGAWTEPGLGGHVTPIFPATIDWHRPDADALWGPSVHWNTHLKQYVLLLNRATDRKWFQEGVYITFNPDPADPCGWSLPHKILDASSLGANRWYPQVIGIDAGARETDKRAGQVARLFVRGRSEWEIVFSLTRKGDP